ncbi:MAG: dephospho-CoA kinase [Fimbriimonadales bacterium]|nr:dephospho-CoA kinase [Fimbriimonadales bacterium]
MTALHHSPFAPRPLRIAITGGVAEGKTTVLRMFESRGGRTISSDTIVAALLRPGTDLWRQLIEEFGETITKATGELDRERMAALAFGNPRLRRRLNRLLHPAAVETLQQLVEETLLHLSSTPQEQGTTPLFIEVPLLIEVGLQGWFDRILVVQATPALQQQRLLARGVPAALARQMLNAQLPTRAKVPFADWVVRTHRSLPEVERQVQRIWEAIQR